MKQRPDKFLVDWAAAAGLILKLGLKNNAEAGEALGVSGSAFNGWKSKGKVPKPIYLALEGLLRRQNGGGSIMTAPSQSRVLVARLNSAEEAAAVELLLERMKIKAQVV